MVATLVLEASAEMRVGSSPTWGTKFRECGVMVATGDLKSPVFGRAGSTPATRTIIRIVSSVGRAPPLQGGCRQFEPVTIHQTCPCSLMVKK